MESSPSPGDASANQGCVAPDTEVLDRSGGALPALTRPPMASDRTIHAAARATRTRLGRELVVGIGCDFIGPYQCNRSAKP